MSSLSPATPLHAHVGRAFVGTEKGEETMLFRVLFENQELKRDSIFSRLTLQ